tara:strand:- start:55 stop:663 length:609 start_codon:yes stop_codon:yes gene_type:complete
MISVIDYGRGNLYSIHSALRFLDVEHEMTDEIQKIANSSHIILPGVGAFGAGINALEQTGLIEPLCKAVRRGVPLLGICLGMQFLVDGSEEFGNHKGLGLIRGKVFRLPKNGSDRIPNVGWRKLEPAPNSFLSNMSPNTMAYFVHSFAPRLSGPQDIAATIPFNGENIPAIIRRENVVGYQFHPEKSGSAGLNLIQNFLEMT